jgi:aminoglycoside phosphotransferase (APT) family kinase protein
MTTTFMPTLDLARKLIVEQFPEYAGLPITDVEKQGHDNRTYRLGDSMLIRMPTAADYALKVPKEQELLPQLAKRLSVSIPAPIKMGKLSSYYPYPFSIYKWLPGKSINLLTLTDHEKGQLAYDLAKFLKERRLLPISKALSRVSTTGGEATMSVFTIKEHENKLQSWLRL